MLLLNLEMTTLFYNKEKVGKRAEEGPEAGKRFTAALN